MKIIVYVEGPSDRLAMEELLGNLLERLREHGIAVEFIPTEGKKRLLTQTPRKALNILRNDPKAIVIALPDLYPPNVTFSHQTFPELCQALDQEFQHQLSLKGIVDARILTRFRVFCFKYDLEALVLAAEPALASRLGAPAIDRAWILPVENQDHDNPPKRIVEQIFAAHGERYHDTIDAPLILGASRYDQIAAACPQCFKPFVDFLESLLRLTIDD